MEKKKKKKKKKYLDIMGFHFGLMLFDGTNNICQTYIHFLLRKVLLLLLLLFVVVIVSLGECIILKIEKKKNKETRN